jgi:hypothetical protein
MDFLSYLNGTFRVDIYCWYFIFILQLIVCIDVARQVRQERTKTRWLKLSALSASEVLNSRVKCIKSSKSSFAAAHQMKSCQTFDMTFANIHKSAERMDDVPPPPPPHVHEQQMDTNDQSTSLHEECTAVEVHETLPSPDN